MLRKLLAIWSACLLLATGFTACNKGDTFTLPAPKPVNEEIPDDDDNGGGGGSGGGGGNTGTLCSDIGQTPIILAYYTENSSALPDVTLLTHINYAHGRFKNPTTGDGGIVISGTSLMKQVIALKSVNPRLKVMLMIGGWGIKADGFSMMARDADLYRGEL